MMMLADRKRVLIAEDEVALAAAYAREFRGAGFEADVVHSGADALALLNSGIPFAALILDIGLPGLDGRDVLASLQNDEVHRGLPVIVVSGREDDYTRSLVLALGARDLVTKPAYAGQLVGRVTRSMAE